MKKGTLIIIGAAIIISSVFLMHYKKQAGDISHQIKSMDTLKISSTAFEAGGLIPQKYTCDGEGVRPDIAFAEIPTGAVSLVLIMDDPDIPDSVKKSRGVESFVHWVVFNISVETFGIPATGAVPGIEGMNSAGKNGYAGPCPPDREHRYFFLLYALDRTLDLTSSATKADVEKGMEGHIIVQTEIIGRYDRKR